MAKYNVPSEEVKHQEETKPTEEPSGETLADGLVPMFKDAEELRVHPTTVSAHEVQGWKVKK